MKAIKKPILVDVVRFDAETDLPPAVRVRFTEKRWTVWNQLHDSWIGVTPGDYLNVTTPGDIYPIDAAYFAEHYDLVPA